MIPGPARALTALRVNRRRIGLERKLVWIFGSPRTGSSWLTEMLSDAPGIRAIKEPLIGYHLFPAELILSRPPEAGPLFEKWPRARDSDYFLSWDYLEFMRPRLRDLILSRLAAQFGSARGDAAVVIQEPNGSQTADTLLWILPRARMIFLVRDPRDVIDSILDASMPGGWAGRSHAVLSSDGFEQRRMDIVRHHVAIWAVRNEAAQRAFDGLPESQRLMVRYENLLADTASQLTRMYRWLGVSSGAEEARATAERHSFDRLAADQVGRGKHARAARPGAWREGLRQEEKEYIHSELGSYIEQLGYER